jgi:sigma-E factor negative regulatory protein RseC
VLETRAIIIQVNGTEAIVEALHNSGCGHCSGGNSCGSGKLSKLFCVRPRRFRARNEIKAQVGEEVRISMMDGALLRSALILYGLPLLLLLGGALLGMRWPGGDAGAASGAGVGLAAGFLLARFAALRQGMHPASGPVIICDRESLPTL